MTSCIRDFVLSSFRAFVGLAGRFSPYFHLSRRIFLVVRLPTETGRVPSGALKGRQGIAQGETLGSNEQQIRALLRVALTGGRHLKVWTQPLRLLLDSIAR